MPCTVAFVPRFSWFVNYVVCIVHDRGHLPLHLLPLHSAYTRGSP